MRTRSTRRKSKRSQKIPRSWARGHGAPPPRTKHRGPDCSRKLLCCHWLLKLAEPGPTYPTYQRVPPCLLVVPSACSSLLVHMCIAQREKHLPSPLVADRVGRSLADDTTTMNTGSYLGSKREVCAIYLMQMDQSISARVIQNCNGSFSHDPPDRGASSRLQNRSQDKH